MSGESFRLRRREADITLEEVGDECVTFGRGEYPSTISRFERGLLRLKPETEERLWWALTSVEARRAILRRNYGVQVAEEALRLLRSDD